MNRFVKIFRMKGLFWMFLGLLISCKKGPPLQVSPTQPIVFDSSSLGKRYQQLYHQYDVLFKNQWDRNAFPVGVRADPPNELAIMPYLEILEAVFLQGLEQVAGLPFVRKNIPTQIFLLGRSLNFTGLATLGDEFGGQVGYLQANRMSLGGLNDLYTSIQRPNSDAAFLSILYDSSGFNFPSQGGLIGCVFHEYAHFLANKYDIPNGFQKPSAHAYMRETSGYESFSDTAAFRLGFFIPFGMLSEREDFATYTQVMVWKTPATIEQNYLVSDAGHTKYQLMQNFYQKIGLSLSALQAHLNRPDFKQQLLNIKRKYETPSSP